MVLRGVSIPITFYVWDSNGDPKTGDAANITVRISKDGGALAASTNAPTEVDATNAPGLYRVVLTATEMDASTIDVIPKSATAGVSCQSIQIITDSTTAGVSFISSIKAQTDKLSFDASNRVNAHTVVNDDKTGYALTTTEHTNIASAVWNATTRTLTSFGTLVSDTASAVWSYVIETGLSAVEWARYVASVVFNKRIYSGGTVRYRDFNDTKDRIVATEDQDGNRTFTLRDGS